MKKRLVIMGMAAMTVLAGCAEKYKLDLGGYGFDSEKTAYAEGEAVTVRYDMIATDTDYRFYTDSDDVELKQDYDGRGYVFTFTMPAHDVKLYVSSRNSMMYDPDAITNSESAPNEAEPAPGEWKCPECGAVNSGKFCAECGSRKPE